MRSTKKFWIPLLLILHTTSVNAQFSFNKLNAMLEEGKSMDLIAQYIESDSINLDDHVRRKIEGGHEQLIAEIRWFWYLSWHILIQADNNRIYLCVINEDHYTEKNDSHTISSVLIKIDQPVFDNFIRIQKDIYQSSPSADQYKQFSVNIYDLNCGMTSDRSHTTNKMLFFVSDTATDSLRRWMQDIDYEKKVLGATGLLVLEKNGVLLNQTDIAQIEHLKKLDFPINYCYGCFGGLTRGSKELLSSKEIDHTSGIIRFLLEDRQYLKIKD